MRCAPVFPTIQYIQSTYYVDFGTGKKAIYRNLRKLNNFKPCSKTQITPLTHYVEKMRFVETIVEICITVNNN